MAESKPPRDLPQVPDSVDPAIRRPLARVIEEVQRLLEFRGDPMDAALTMRKATARGLLDSMGRALTGNVTYVNTFPTTGGSSGGDAPDLTPPPTVTGLTVVAGFTQVIVQFDAPTYTQGHGNLQTNIYANRKDPGDPTLPAFGDAVLVFSAPGALNIVSIPSELNTRWHVWAKYQTVDGVESVTAAGGVNGYNVAGVYPTTGQDVAQLLEVLAGQIREGQLYAALAEQIRSIVRRADDAAEDAIRAALATHAASRRAVAGLLAEAAARGTSIAQTQVLIAQGDSQLAAQISLLQAVVNDPATGVAATASALDIVETLAEDTADGVAALAGRTELLEASVDTPATGLLARAGLLETAVAEANDDIGAVATRTTTLEARVESPSATPGDPDYNPTYAALQTTQSTLATLDGRASSTYAVRTTISAGGRTLLGGFGLMGDSAAAPGTEIEFGILASRFWVGAPIGSGVDDTQLFTLQTTTWDDNGVSRPAGAFIDAAFIKNLTAIYATIANLVADDITAASISVSQLVAGSLAVGAYAQSTGFVSGTSGWRINGNGVAEFSGVVVRGTIYATAGSIGGNAIDSTGMQSPGYSAGSTGWRLDTSGLLRAFASSGTRVLDLAATGTAPVLKIGSALELLANGDAYFGGRLAIGTVSANGSTTASASFPSLPNSAATYSTGPIAFSPSASITGVGGNISAWVSCDVKVAAESTAVDAIRVFAYLYRNGTQVDSSEVFLRSCVFPDPTGARRVAAAEVTLLSPLEPLTGAQVFTIGFDVKFYDNTGTAITPGTTAFTSYLQVVGRANLQEIKV